MARSPLALHPSVRERIEPRMSAAALAEYLILRSDQQDAVLHDSRFSRPPIVSAYADAIRVLKAYNGDRTRPAEKLESAKRELTAKAAWADIKPKTREGCLHCIEVIELFQAAENALGTRGMPLRETSRFAELEVEGVTLSVQPDFLVEALDGGGSRRVGAVMLRLAKAPDPNACRLEATKQSRGEHRHEMARYMIAMMQMLLERKGASLGRVDRDLLYVLDVRLGERIGAGADHTARLRAIRSGCNHIARLWDTVEPRASILRNPT